MKHELSLPYLLLKPLLEQLPQSLQFLNSDHVVMVTVITLFLLVFLPMVGRKLGANNRSGLQQTFEVAYDAVRGMIREKVEHHPERHYTIIATFGLVVLIFNVSGAIPLLTTPTPYLSTTVAMAIASFTYYNVQGFKAHGAFGYAKTLMGPTPALAPIMFTSEVISHLARLLSLSLRLSGSMSADHVVVGAFAILFPFVIPAPMVGLGMLMAFLQTYIFILLSTTYIGAAVSEEH